MAPLSLKSRIIDTNARPHQAKPQNAAYPQRPRIPLGETEDQQRRQECPPESKRRVAHRSERKKACVVSREATLHPDHKSETKIKFLATGTLHWLLLLKNIQQFGTKKLVLYRRKYKNDEGRTANGDVTQTNQRKQATTNKTHKHEDRRIQ